jgi:hypothetical protein
MKRPLLLLTTLLSIQSFSQTTISTFGKEPRSGDPYTVAGFNPMISTLSNPVAPFPERHKQSALSFDFTFRKINTDKGKARFNYNNKALGDAINLLLQTFSAEDGENVTGAQEESYISNLIGYMDWAWNLNSGESRIQASLGFNLNDYLYYSRYTVDSLQGSLITFNPQGWYWSAGPHFGLNAVVTKDIQLEFAAGYSFAYWHAIDLDYAYNPDEPYPLPQFGQVKAELMSRWGFFLCGHYNWIKNRGHIPNAGKRFDLIFGYKFSW